MPRQESLAGASDARVDRGCAARNRGYFKSTLGTITCSLGRAHWRELIVVCVGRQHVGLSQLEKDSLHYAVILVRKKDLSQLEKDNMW